MGLTEEDKNFLYDVSMLQAGMSPGGLRREYLNREELSIEIKRFMGRLLYLIEFCDINFAPRPDRDKQIEDVVRGITRERVDSQKQLREVIRFPEETGFCPFRNEVMAFAELEWDMCTFEENLKNL